MLALDYDSLSYYVILSFLLLMCEGLARVSKRCPHRLSILTKVLPDPLFLDLVR